jgi:hypothetical protein
LIGADKEDETLPVNEAGETDDDGVLLPAISLFQVCMFVIMFGPMTPVDDAGVVTGAAGSITMMALVDDEDDEDAEEHDSGGNEGICCFTTLLVGGLANAVEEEEDSVI